jgi:hypothetical protein
MRALVFLLILVNLLFLAWTQGYFASSSDPDGFRLQQQLLADQIKVVARDEAPAESVKAEKPVKAEEKKVLELCLSLADLPVADGDRVESLLAEKWPSFKAQRTTVEGSASYWVYIPALASKQDADNKVAELKKLRVPEYFIVQENGPNKWAISLGLFSSKEAAAARLDALRNQGVRSARAGERNAKPATAQFEIRGPETQVDMLRKAIAELLPDSRLLACKKPATP